MIVFKVSQVDEAAVPYLGIAKAQARRLVEGMAWLKMPAFSKTWLVGDVSIHAQGVEYWRDEWLVKLRLTSAGGSSIPIVRLGEAAPTMSMNKTGEPLVVTTPSARVTRKSMVDALLAGRKVSYLEPYLAPILAPLFSTPTCRIVVFGEVNAGAYGLSSGAFFDSTVSGLVASSDIIGLRELDFDSSHLWVEYTPSGFNKRAWAPLSISVLVESYVSALPVTRVFDPARQRLVIPDGVQTFSIPMAEGCFAIPVKVTFKDEKVTVPAVSKTEGLWEFVAIATRLIDEQTIEFTFDQVFWGRRAYFPAGAARTWTLGNAEQFVVSDPTIPSHTDVGVIRPDVFGNDSPGNITRMFYSPKVVTTSWVNILSDVSLVPDPIVYLVEQQTFRTTPSSQAVKEFGENANIATYSENWYRDTVLTAYTRNGLAMVLSDPVMELGAGESLPVGTPITYAWYGVNGLTREQMHPYSTSLRDKASWTDSLTALGYSIARSVPPREGFPADKELYEIKYGDAALRTAVRARTGAFVAASGIEVAFTQIAIASQVAISAGAPSHSIQAMVRLNHRQLDHAFKGYDAPVSIGADVVVVRDLDIAGQVLGDACIAILPPGWQNANRNRLRALLNPDGSATKLLVDAFVNDSATEFNAVYDANEDQPEAEDLINRMDAIREFDSAMQALVALAPSASGAIAAGLTSIKAMFAVFASSDSDHSFPELMDTLIRAYQPVELPATPRATQLNNPEVASIIAGYFSAHMRVPLNTAKMKHKALLILGPGTFFRVKGA